MIQSEDLAHEGDSKPGTTQRLKEVSLLEEPCPDGDREGLRNRAATYPDLDAGSGGSTEPVAVGAEAQGVDDVSSVQGVEVFAFIQVPQHGLAVLWGRRRSQSKPQRSSPAPGFVPPPRRPFFPPQPQLSWSTLPRASADTEKLKDTAGKFKENASRAET